MFESKNFWLYPTTRYFSIKVINSKIYEPAGDIAVFITDDLSEETLIRIKVDDETIQVPFKVMKGLWFPVGYCEELSINKLVNGEEEEVKGLIRETKTYIEQEDEEEEENPEEEPPGDDKPTE